MSALTDPLVANLQFLVGVSGQRDHLDCVLDPGGLKMPVEESREAERKVIGLRSARLSAWNDTPQVSSPLIPQTTVRGHVPLYR